MGRGKSQGRRNVTHAMALARALDSDAPDVADEDGMDALHVKGEDSTFRQAH